MKTDGAIVILSYPDTVVRPAYTEFSSKIWPFFGAGSKHAVQAGHAALLLIQKKTGVVDYYDFGRYITSFGFGRVRSKDTDVELEVPLKAVFKDDTIDNIEELLLWLEAHPEKTHGEGRLVASVNPHVDYSKAQSYIQKLLHEKEVAYGAFVKPGSNCARFVTDTLIAATTHKKIKRKLKASSRFTPSPISNVIRGNTTNEIYKVYQQQVELYHNRSVAKEHGACFFNKFDHEPNLIGTELPNKDLFDLKNGTWLGGIGSGAWFVVESEQGDLYRISRYTYDGTRDFSGLFAIDREGFSLKRKYEFLHPTNCTEALIIQDEQKFVFTKA